MHVGEMARVKGIALACGMMAVVLAAAIGFSVLVPECAHASGTKTMWVVATETSDAYGGDESGPTVSTFWYDKNGLLILKLLTLHLQRLLRFPLKFFHNLLGIHKITTFLL